MDKKEKLMYEYLGIKRMDEEMAQYVGTGRVAFRHIKGLLFSLRNKIYDELLDEIPTMKW